jgi:molybdate transport system substrate-binding protein
VRQFRSLCVATVAAALVLAACGSSSKDNASTKSSGKLSGSVTVLAASSLTKGFTGLGEEFRAAHPGTKIEFSFGSSSDLEQSIEEGAPADVFASADQKNMTNLVAAGDNSGAPANFARNRLEIAVEKGNPKHIAKLSDLAEPGVTVVLCDPSAPCGKFAAEVLDNAHVNLTPKSLEVGVKATLSKVELGEADAAIVYISDVTSSGKVDGVDIPDDVNILTTLPIVALKDSKNAALAKAFVDFVVAHQSGLVSKYGFLPL